MLYVPYITEEGSSGETRHDIFSRLLKDRVIFINSQINDDVAGLVMAQMLFLAKDDPERNISLYINSPGGSIYSGLAIYDTMQHISPKVETLCFGMAASMAAVLLAGGEPGLRTMLPNSRVMIHQPLGGVSGQASDIKIVATEISRLKDKLNSIMAYHTGQELSQIAVDTERDYYMNAPEALDYGIVDSILAPNSNDDTDIVEIESA